jgi:hypothetical protein
MADAPLSETPRHVVARGLVAVPADELRFQHEQEIYGIEELPITW